MAVSLDSNRWLYFAEEHRIVGGVVCPGSGDNVLYAWEAKTGDLSASGLTPAPQLLEVGPCSVCQDVVEVRRRS